MLRLHPLLIPRIQEVLDAHIANGRRGTPEGTGGRLSEGRSAGPLGLLLHPLREVGAYLDADYVVHFTGGAPVRLLTDPIQLIKNRTLAAHFREQLRALGVERQALGGSDRD